MCAVVLFEKDPFEDGLDPSLVDPDIGTGSANVRRPLFGMLPKPQTFSYVAVYSCASGKTALTPNALRDSSAPGGTSYANHNFFIQGVVHRREERAQVMETFGDHFVFFYGDKPIVLQVQGILVNSPDFNWRNEWLYNYDKFLRGTKCVENQARVYLGYDDIVVEGYILNTSCSESADQPMLSPFGFSMLVTNWYDLSEGSPAYVAKSEDSRTQANGVEFIEYLSDVQSIEGFVDYSYQAATEQAVAEAAGMISNALSGPSQTEIWDTVDDGQIANTAGVL